MSRSTSNLKLQNDLNIQNITSASQISTQIKQKQQTTSVVFVCCLWFVAYVVVMFSCWGMSLAKRSCVGCVGETQVLLCVLVVLSVVCCLSTYFLNNQPNCSTSNVFVYQLTKLLDTTRNPRNCIIVGAKVGKPTCMFIQLWSLQYCIQAMDMISACIIIYKTDTTCVQQLCYVEGQQWCYQEAGLGMILEREKGGLEGRRGGGQRGNASFNKSI